MLELAVSGSTVYAGGRFTIIGGQARNYVAALDAGTGNATSWNPNANYPVRALAVSGSTVYVGGDLTSIGGQTRNNIAALDVSTGAVTTWYPFGGAPTGVVRCLAVGGGRVYAGGGFHNIGGFPGTEYLAALDATTGSPIGTWGGAANASVNALFLNGGTLYAGGAFVNIGGANRNYIAALDATTGQATAWNPDAGGGPSTNVGALAVNGSTVYAGGNFESMGGQPRYYIAALDAATGLASAWPNGGGVEVRSLVVSGGTLYVGGYFSDMGGGYRESIAALDPVTGLATSWDPGSPGEVNALAVGGGSVYVGGLFGSIGGQDRAYIASVDAGTALATPWNPSITCCNVTAVALIGGSAYVGGNFTSISGQPRSGIACLGPAGVSAVPSGDPSFDSALLRLGPNPTRGRVEIEYTLPQASKVRIRIYDLQGRLVADPVDELRPAGTSQVSWDGTGNAGEAASGIYFVRLEAPGLAASGRFVIAR